MKDLDRINEILNGLRRGKIQISYAAQEFWCLLCEFSEQLSEILARVPPEILYQLIRAGLLSADPDMFRLGEENIWFREKVGSVIRSLDRDELEEVSKAILNSGLERSALASRVFYMHKKLR